MAAKQAVFRRPTLFVTMGAPGAGKTYFARRFARLFHLQHLNSDRIRAELRGEATTAPADRHVFAVMQGRARRALEGGRSVVYDANLTLAVYRAQLKQLAESAGAAYVSIVVDTPGAVARARVDLRNARLVQRPHPQPRHEAFVPGHVYDSITSEMEPSEQDASVVIRGVDPYRVQLRHVLEYLKASDSCVI